MFIRSLSTLEELLTEGVTRVYFLDDVRREAEAELVLRS